MSHSVDLVLMLALALGAALALGLATQALKLSPIVGYLMAGVIVGPFTPGFFVDTKLAEQSAELGVVLLMFGVGLHFHVRDLLAVWRVAVPGALVQIACATGLGVLVARAFGWSFAAGIVFGLAISVASTVVLVRVLSDHDALHATTGRVAVGWLVVEDLFTVIALVVLPIVVAPSAAGGSASIAGELGMAVVRIGAVVGLAWAIGRFGAPWLLATVSKTRSRELFTLTVLVLAIGIAAGSATVFGVSMALGAFLAGMVVGQSEFSFRAASEALPMRDAFSALFFVSIGMLLDPRALSEHALLVLATLAVIVLGKGIVAFVAARLLRCPLDTALGVAVALAQIGEFSFILANVGRSTGALPAEAVEVLVVASIASISLNPLLYRLVGPLARRLAPSTPDTRETPALHEFAPRVVVVGHGPVGRTVTRLLQEHAIATTVVELNHETVRSLLAQGQRAIYGDASQPTILEHAGIRSAQTLVFAASGTPPEAVVENARSLNPELRILARSTYVSEVPAARRAGADVVVSAEVEVALALAETLLYELGASPEQLDRARAAARKELTPASST